jgi:hypothetical protein
MTSDYVDEPMIPENETPAEMRARFRRWSTEETDSYYRHQFWLASLTPHQRLARWWWINRPVVLHLLVLVGVCVALGVWVS